MTNEEFQKVVLAKLEDSDKVQRTVLNKLSTVETDIKDIKTRQDEIYQVVRAIEHSNNVGKSELDSHNIRIAKVEGKIKKVAKAYNEEIEIDKALNL